MAGKPVKPTWYGVEPISSYADLMDKLKEEYSDVNSSWVFRGQLAEDELSPSLERYCKKSRIDWTEIKDIEFMILREFRRLYDGEDCAEVMNDTLYCLSLLRHYGAPTRLLDFSYSKFVGLYFGLKDAYDSLRRNARKARFALWCIDVKEMNHKARELYEWDRRFLQAFDSRIEIKKRDDTTFKPLYLGDNYELVVAENPGRIHKRLHLQQGVLLCPGNLSKSFIDNLQHVYKSSSKTKVRKLDCSLKVSELEEAFRELKDMNITEESLFPGLDGLARSVRYQMWFHRELLDRFREEGGSTK